MDCEGGGGVGVRDGGVERGEGGGVGGHGGRFVGCRRCIECRRWALRARIGVERWGLLEMVVWDSNAACFEIDGSKSCFLQDR